MKEYSLLKALLGSAAITFASVSYARDAAPAASPSASDTTSGSQSGGSQGYVQRLVEILGLSDAQVTQIKTLLQNSAEQFKTIQEDGTLAQDQKSAQISALKTNINQQINALLTPEQQQKFSALLNQFLQHHAHRK